MPVIVLTDQSIAQRRETIAAASLEHEVVERRIADAGRPERLPPLPRHRRRRLADERPGHAPAGCTRPTASSTTSRGVPNSIVRRARADEREALPQARRDREEVPAVPTASAPTKPELGILCWGSSTGAVREAHRRAERRSDRVGAFVPRMIDAAAAARAAGVHRRLRRRSSSIELSYAAQFYAATCARRSICRASKTHVYARSGGKALGAQRKSIDAGASGCSARTSRGGAGMTCAPLHAERLQDRSEAGVVSRLRRLRRSQLALPRAGRSEVRAARHRGRLRHRLLVAPAGLRRDVRLQLAARPRAADRDRREAGRARPDGDRGRRRRRRHRHRRQSLPPRRAAQRRHRLLHDGQRDLRSDEGPGRADDADRRQDEVDDVRQSRSGGRSVRAWPSRSARRGSAAASPATSRGRRS